MRRTQGNGKSSPWSMLAVWIAYPFLLLPVFSDKSNGKLKEFANIWWIFKETLLPVKCVHGYWRRKESILSGSWMMGTHNAVNYTNIEVNVLGFNTDILLLLSRSKVTYITVTCTQSGKKTHPGVVVSNNPNYRAFSNAFFYNSFAALYHLLLMWILSYL